MFLKRKTMFDLIREADDDNQSDTAQNQTDQTQAEAPAPEESGQDANEDDYGNKDDFNMDTEVDDQEGEEGGEDAAGGDTGTDTGMDAGDTGTDDTGMDTGGDTGGGGEGGEEPAEDEPPVDANTDIFGHLSAEEQQVKIKELKRLYANLYSSTDDMLAKINELETDEGSIETMSRVTSVLYSLKTNIEDYMRNHFAHKSYIENDVTFNRYLSILNSVSSIIEDLADARDKELEKNRRK